MPGARVYAGAEPVASPTAARPTTDARPADEPDTGRGPPDVGPGEPDAGPTEPAAPAGGGGKNTGPGTGGAIGPGPGGPPGPPGPPGPTADGGRALPRTGAFGRAGPPPGPPGSSSGLDKFNLPPDPGGPPDAAPGTPPGPGPCAVAGGSPSALPASPAASAARAAAACVSVID